MSKSAPSISLEFRNVDQNTWKDLEQLFESRGGPKNCWCMVWRATPAESKQASSHTRKAALKKRVDAGTPIGIVGYDGEEPLAWCSIAPRATYLRLGGIEDEQTEKVWSLVCMYVARRLRGKGISQQLIDAAIAQAKKRGATLVEAYPVDPESPSYRFMGFVKTFEAAGFEMVGHVGTRRHIMRRRIR